MERHAEGTGQTNETRRQRRLAEAYLVVLLALEEPAVMEVRLQVHTSDEPADDFLPSDETADHTVLLRTEEDHSRTDESED
jgi:hypothetical protein